MIKLMRWLSGQANDVVYYTGSLTLGEWQECEANMNMVYFDHMNYIIWWHNTRRKSMSKTPSLPNMICDMNGIPFDHFYDSVFLQEADI